MRITLSTEHLYTESQIEYLLRETKIWVEDIINFDSSRATKSKVESHKRARQLIDYEMSVLKGLMERFRAGKDLYNCISKARLRKEYPEIDKRTSGQREES